MNALGLRRLGLLAAIAGPLTLLFLAPSTVAAQQGQTSTPSTPAAATTREKPGQDSPARPKATNRAAPVEPPGATPRAGEEPAVTAAPMEPTAPAAPAAASSIPVFANPSMQSFGPGAPVQPPAAAAAAAYVPPAQPDWRHSKAPVDAAFGAYQRGLYVSAMKEALKVTADDPGNAAAMTLIGEIYRDGLGVKQDPVEAARWYRLADDRGDPQAAFALARAHIEGLGVPQDYKKAKDYFERAAAKDHAGALYNLGIIAIEGEIKDFRTAAQLFQRSSKLGDVEATYSLAFLYRNGQGVEKDEERATQLLHESADRHHLASMIDYAISLFNGRGTKADEPGAAVYLIRAAWRNAPVAQNRLARMYVAGRGVKSDMIEAMKWHVLARANGLKDEWLDVHLNQLTANQREMVEEAVKKFAVK